MCGIIDDVVDFAKDSVGEIFRHPGEALGAAFGVPGFDPFFGGMFNSDHSLLSPTGNFTSSAWNDMYNANPGDTGALNLFHGVNDVADKIAPAAAGYFAAPALAGALGGTTGEAATGLGSEAFATGLGDTASTSLGGLEGSLGGAALLGPAAGTGTAIGAAAEGLGAGGLGVAGPSALGGLTASSGAFTGPLGGSTSGTGLGGYTGGAQVPQTSPTLSGGAANMESSQALANGASANPDMTSGGGAPYGYQQATAGYEAPADSTNLSTLYGAGSTASQSPMGGAIQASTNGVGNNVMSGALGQGTAAGGTGVTASDLKSVFDLAKSGYGAYQQWHQGQQAQNYMNSLNQMFAPNSPYAQQMAQTLGRQDAAAGRNSQYGTRSVQLAAALAQAQANVMGGNNYAAAAQNANKGNMLNSLFSNFSDPKQLAGLYNLGSSGFNGLASLFG